MREETTTSRRGGGRDFCTQPAARIEAAFFFQTAGGSCVGDGGVLLPLMTTMTNDASKKKCPNPAPMNPLPRIPQGSHEPRKCLRAAERMHQFAALGYFFFVFFRKKKVEFEKKCVFQNYKNWGPILSFCESTQRQVRLDLCLVKKNLFFHLQGCASSKGCVSISF